MYRYCITFCLLLSLESIAQVGIGTSDPKATLDINGDMIIRSVDMIPEFTNDLAILVRDKSEKGDHKVREISAHNLLHQPSSSVYSAQKTGGFSLVALNILGNQWARTNLGSGDHRLGNESLFSNGVYTAPEKGIYRVMYEVELQSGIDLSILGGKQLAILKNNAIWDSKFFDAVRVALGVLNVTVAEMPVTSTILESVVQLDHGDRLTFAMSRTLLNVNVLNTGKVKVHVYKVSH